MRRITLLLIFCLTLLTVSVHAQEVTDREVEYIAGQLSRQLETLEAGSYNVMVTDFTDGDVAPTELGKYLAEEFSYHFSLINKEGLNIIDRSRLKALLQEQGLIRDELIDPLETVRLGKLKGMSHLLYGTIIASGEYYTVYVKLIDVETQAVLASTRGRISIVPSLPANE